MKSQEQIRKHYDECREEYNELRQKSLDALSDDRDVFDDITAQVDEMRGYLMALEYVLNSEPNGLNIMESMKGENYL